jgi:hypothetical protein
MVPPKYDSIEQQFQALDQRRYAAMVRKRECAEATIPALLPPVGMTEDMELPVPYNSSGAFALTMLASKLASTTVPSNNASMFTFDISQYLSGNESPEEIDGISDMLIQIERQTMDLLYTSNLRPSINTAMQHLVVCGDVLVCQEADGDFVVHRVDNYVVQRTLEGEPGLIIVREWVATDLLPPSWAALGKGMPVTPARNGYEPVYTRIKRDMSGVADDYAEVPSAELESGKEVWKVEKEFRREPVPDATGTYQVSAHWPLRWNGLAGENYGRSITEDLLGDHRTLQSLTKSLIEGAAANAEYRFGVNPGGVTEIDDIANSVNGQWVPARKDDIFPIQLGSSAQVQVTAAMVQAFETKINRAYLVASGTQPTGERVTATAIRQLAQELDDGLGGQLSAQQYELSVPMIRRTLGVLQSMGKLSPKFLELIDKGMIKIRLRTGIEALNREVEGAKLSSILDRMRAYPPEAQKVIKWQKIVATEFQSAGFVGKDFVLTADEIKAQQDDQMHRQLALNAGSSVAAEAAKASYSQPQPQPPQ